MIANKIPTQTKLSGTYAEVAELYGLTEKELRNALVDELQNEGYCQNCGFESKTSHDWLIHDCVDTILKQESALDYQRSGEALDF